jgi:TP901-1 family phage major tail protein
MGTCNTAQNEMGGKELLLKACVDASVASTDTSANFVSVAHGLKVGDIVKFITKGANTTFNLTDFYYVKEIVDVDTFKFSATKSGAAIVADDTEAAMDILLFKSTGGLRSKSLSFSAEGVDITNEESDEWKVMLDKAGMRSLEISGSGVYNNYPVFQTLVDKFLANELTCLMFVEVKTGKLYEGCFKLTSLEISGDYDAESNYSISASSSGTITIAVIAA